MLTFLHISDTHISADPDYHPHWVHESVAHPNHSVESLIRYVNQLSYVIDFILHTGDVCADSIPTDYDCARNLLHQFQVPVYMIPGNHDSAELMKTHLHDGQHIHVLQDNHLTINGYHLITLDTNGVGDAHAPTVTEKQIRWFDAELKRTNGEPLIVALHHPLIQTGIDWIDYRMRVQNGDSLHQCLSQHIDQLRGVFHGHIHQPTASYCDGVLYIATPSTWYNLHAYPGLQYDEDDLFTVGGCNLVMIRDNRTFIRRISIDPAG